MMNTNTTIANQQQHSTANQQHAVHNPQDAARKTHLTKFAFLFSAARAEGYHEPVVGMHHDVDMAACFSKRHLNQHQPLGGGSTTASDSGGIPITPPSISSSSLSMHSKNNNNTPGPQNGRNDKNSLLEMAAMNMSTPFYTTPDTVSSTAKTVLTNVVSTMEELMDSRLRSTASQLVKRGSTTSSSSNQLLFLRLLSPSRNPIQIGTVVTRFILPEMNNDNGENILGTTKSSASTSYSSSTNNDMLSIPLVFKATIDIKVFGQMSTVELSTPVTMTGKFDSIDLSTADNSEASLLLNAVDVSFDCTTLLQNMISQARIIVKIAVTRAAELSVQISKYVNKNTSQNKTKSIKKATSLHSLVGGSISLGSLNSLFSTGTNFSGLDNNKMKKPRSLLRNPLPSNNRTSKLDYPLYSTSLNDNANATFDLEGGVNNNDTNIQQQYQVNNETNSVLGNRTTSVVRFQMPVDTSKNQVQKQQQQRPQDEVDQPNNKGNNIHAGLFSWLQEDSMFLSEKKMEEQNKIDEERERKRREAPQPMRFFTAAEDPEMVSKSIFGNGAEQQQNGEDHRDKRRKV